MAGRGSDTIKAYQDWDLWLQCAEKSKGAVVTEVDLNTVIIQVTCRKH